MRALVDRDFVLNLGGTLIRSRTEAGERRPVLRVVFKIDRHLSKESNTAEIEIYNLKESTRGLISQKGIQTTLEAGYVDDSHVIFSGKLDYGSTTRSGPDWVSSLESTDGGKEMRTSRINVSYKSIGFGEAIKAAAESMGLGLGNIEEKIRAGNIRGALEGFASGLVLNGQASTQFDKLVNSFGYEWSVQDEQLIILEPGGTIDPGRAIVLNQASGLVGSPQAGDDGLVEARSLLIPSMLPGRKVKIESELVDGFFRVERSVFVGDTWGQDWYTEIEAKPL